MTSRIITLALALAVVAPTAATAGIAPQSDAAMRKGIRDYAKHGLRGNTAQATKMKVKCVNAAKVSSTRPCSGTFSLTIGGRTAHYRLTEGARTFRISPGAMEYHLKARATKKAPGLPTRIWWVGILQ